ncbi:MAG: 30S ribosomal protein S6 [Patescibacteria group bacterium]|uniref:Small ribosomal subunit protein bS6 n=1 Tax=candidate division WWE3 bacterium TaxID=2053526 RepID=A0A955EC97_UNCKA|nr:30S ribosomal protein S6 [candidate division WWE3 bacterium]
MNKYEIMTITKNSVGEAGAAKAIAQVTELINANKGSVEGSKSWGKRKLVYEINHEDHGYYDVVDFTLSPSKLAVVKAKLNLMPNIVRYLITAK